MNVNEVSLPAPAEAAGGADELNRWLGRREAFSLVAGRCSAADVECMRRIRDEKLFLSRARDWPEFCETRLHMSKTKANHLIWLLGKFGPGYFHITQITRISEAEYRTIAPAVSDQGIEAGGEVIPLTPDNSTRIAAAVAALRAGKAPPQEQDIQRRVAALDTNGDRLLKQYRELRRELGTRNPNLSGSLQSLQIKVYELIREVA